VFYRIRQKIIPSTSIGLACRAISGIYNVYNRCFGWCFDREFFNPYVQLSGGLTVDHKNTGAVCIEYGSTYKWFDIALAADYESNSFAKEYTGEVNYSEMLVTTHPGRTMSRLLILRTHRCNW
jgi:hypothetical protein